jgi:hypothetical protein
MIRWGLAFQDIFPAVFVDFLELEVRSIVVYHSNLLLKTRRK